MSFLDKFRKTSENNPKVKNINKIKKDNKIKTKKIKKKTRIGFKPIKDKQINEEINKNPEIKENKKKKKEKIEKEKTENITKEQNETFKTDEINPEDLAEQLIEETEKTVDEKIGEKKWTKSKKKKKILPVDMKGKPVYLEDTGEKLGNVFDMIYDGHKQLVGYKIKDEKTNSTLTFPVDQFDTCTDGLIFVQGWYTKAEKTIEQLEFKERVSPELTTLLADDTISNEELYNIFVKHDDQMAHYIEEAVSLKELIIQRLKVLEKQRLALKDSLMDLTEKRLIKDVDRREFSEDVMKHRRKVNVLDVNIKKCKEILKRLDQTSFGKLGDHIITKTGIKNPDIYQKPERTGDSLVLTEEIETPYKQKYIDIKERYSQLEEEYNELKNAVEKLISKNEL
jgi:hypothetical protein